MNTLTIRTLAFVYISIKNRCMHAQLCPSNQCPPNQYPPNQYPPNQYSPNLCPPQLVRECRDTLEQAIEIRKFYRERIELVTRNNPCKLAQVEADIEGFETDLKCLLEVSLY